MRNFFNSHWKTILAILLAIVLAMVTTDTGSSEPPLAERLRVQAQALASTTPRDALQHIATSLADAGYTPRRQPDEGAAHGGQSVEVALGRVAPGTQASRSFIVGARLGPDGIAGAAAVLELARAAKHLRLAPGTELRFVFFVHDDGPYDALRRDGGNFIAYLGPRAAAAQVRQTLAALRSDPMLAYHGLAAPAQAMGVTSSGHGDTALVITDTGILRFPYFRAGAPADYNDDDSMARIVSGLTRTLGALAGAVET